MKNFLEENINVAILVTQYDLRGFTHPLGFREIPPSTKSFNAATGNFICYAAGLGKGDDASPTDKGFVDYYESSFEDYLAMCKRLAADCNTYQKEAIQLLIKDIVKRHARMEASVKAGRMKPCAYLTPLKKDNRWGKAVLALAEAFEVDLTKKRPSKPRKKK